MNLADKRELLVSKSRELKKINKEREKMMEKLQSENLEEKEIGELEIKAKAVTEEFSKTEVEIKSLEKEIETEEKTLKTISDLSVKNINLKGDKDMNYLKTKEALKDFAHLLEETGGREKLKKAWGEHLKTKGISNPEVLLPTAVVTAITDAFQKSGSIFATFRYTGLTMLKVALNTNTADATSRAKGHKKGVDKDEQVITLTPKEIRAQYIYKYITVDKETLRETRINGGASALLNYILQELPQRIIMEIERAAMIGDGRLVGANDKISSYEAINRAVTDSYVSVQEASASDLLGDLINMDATVTASGSRYLVVSRQTLANIKLTSNQGGLVFPIGSDIASALGYTAIFTPDWMTVADAPVAIEYVGDSYKTVGDNTMESFENFELSKNKNEYLMEIYSGGGIDTPKSAAVLLPNG